MKHPTKIKGFDGSIKDAARAIAVMRYDKVRELFEALADEFCKEAKRDGDAGKIRLSVELGILRSTALQAVDVLDKIWNICEKRMRPRRK